MDQVQPGLRRQIMEPFIAVTSGTIVEFLNPKPHQIKIHDIAWHLARQCRYGSHIRGWYSNAEHSLLGCEQTEFRHVKRAFLIHDAAEYVFGDIPSPVGRLCPEYKQLIRGFQNYLNIHFIGRSLTEAEEAEVNDIDKRICASEMRDLRHNPEWMLMAEPYPIGQVMYWQEEWESAYDRFMKAFKHLFPEYDDA